MEERLPVAGSGSHDCLGPQTGSIPTAGYADENHDSFPVKVEPAFRSGTYVVQVPKDQIYRVPPPEHALIADRHKQPHKKRPRCSCYLCIIVSVVVVAIVLGLVGGISSVFLKHNSPTFHIENVLVLVKNPPHQQKQHPEYDISLKAQNPNQHVRISYGEGGDASLSFRHQELAVAKYPSFDQAPKNSTVFKMIFHGSEIVLPKSVEKSMKSPKQKVNVTLSLSMGVPIKLEFGVLKSGSRKLSVACNMTVDTLAKKNTRVLSQECHTES